MVNVANFEVNNLTMDCCACELFYRLDIVDLQQALLIDQILLFCSILFYSILL